MKLPTNNKSTRPVMNYIIAKRGIRAYTSMYEYRNNIRKKQTIQIFRRRNKINRRKKARIYKKISGH